MVRRTRTMFLLIAGISTGIEMKAQSCGAFDVASIRQNVSGTGGGYPELAPGARRFSATNQLMVELIMFAYDVSPLQVSGLPAAFSQKRYDIEARCEQPIAKEQLPRLLRSLLEERFHLSVHRESKEQSVYALVLGKNGPKLHPTSHEGAKPSFNQSGYSFTFTAAAPSNLSGVLSQVTGRKVLDKTGLSGHYDFSLRYAPDRGGARPEEWNSLPDSVFTALREQLGLDLKAEKDRIEFIVIDRLDQLSPN